MSVQTYFAIGSTLAAMVNLESSYSIVANVLPDALIPLTGLVRRRSLSGIARHDGNANGVLRVDFLSQADKRAFMYAVFGGSTTPSVSRYMTLIDEDGYYSPFSVIIDKPAFGVISGGYLRGIEFALTDCTLQSATKTGGYTVTTSDHLLYCNTASGSITLALPALSGVTANVVFSAVKTSASNTLTLNPDGAETINSASTYAVTANNARVDFVKNDSGVWVTI